jgi:hypothetical protein
VAVLPYADDSVDVVLSSLMPHHLPAAERHSVVVRPLMGRVTFLAATA